VTAIKEGGFVLSYQTTTDRLKSRNQLRLETKL